MLLENPLFYGGGEIHAYEISKNFVKFGHTVDFIQLYGVPRKRELKQNQELIPSRWAPSPKFRFANFINARLLWLYSFLTIPLIIRDLCKGKYDVVHVHGFGYSSLLISAVMAKRIKHSKVFCTLHNDLLRHIDRKLVQILSQYVDTFIAVSPAIQRSWQAVYGSKPVFIPNGVDTSRFNFNVDGSLVRKRLGVEYKYVVLSIGRLSSQKGIKYLIEAANLVKKDIPEIAFLIGGRGEEEASLKRLVNELELNDIMSFLGFIKSEDLPLYYAACDVFVLPSVFETFSLTLLEALSVGKPVICTKVGGAREVAIQFENSEYTRLVNPKEPEELAKGISWYFYHHDFASFNKKAVSKKLESYSWENISRKINSLYEERVPK